MPDVSTEVAIATTTLSSAQGTITFSSIPATYTDLRLVVVTKATASYTLGIQFNSDTATNYSRTYLRGNGSAASSTRQTSQNYIGISQLASAQPVLSTVDIFSYAGSTNKTVLATCNADENGSGEVYSTVGLWRSTSAINTIVVLADSTTMGIGTTATLYGIL